MYQEKVQVLWNERIGPQYFRMGLTCHPGYGASTPGQFVMLRFPDRLTPFLRRPFSIHRLLRQGDSVCGIELLYKTVGEGTRHFSRCRKGDPLDLVGPLGSGFSVSDRYRRIFMAAGGIGVAPMRFLIDFFMEKNLHPKGVTLFLGGRSKADLLCRDAFADLGVTVVTTTDDGSEGDQCLVTQPLESAMDGIPPDIVYACGPLDMLRCVIDLAEGHGVRCQVSIETAMACGIGACLGCAVEGRGESGKYLHACLDGPVFDTETIRLGRAIHPGFPPHSGN